MFLSSCRKLCNPLFARPRRPAQNRLFRPRLEGLEDRTVLAAPKLWPTGMLEITGSTQQEMIKVEFDNGSNLAIAYDDRVVVTLDFIGGPDGVYYFAKWKNVGGGWMGWQRNVTSIVYNGLSGYNFFGNYTDIDSTAYGGNDGNQFLGGSGNDNFFGGAATDYFYGGGGVDWLVGRGGADYLYGEGGNDHLYGEGGIDYLHGGSDDDHLNGGLDGLPDQLWGESGNDTFVAEFFVLVSVIGNRDLPNDFGAGDQMV
jgi:hypothetical protein